MKKTPKKKKRIGKLALMLDEVNRVLRRNGYKLVKPIEIQKID